MRLTILLNWLISIGTMISISDSSNSSANTITIMEAGARLIRFFCNHSTCGFNT